MDSPAMKKPRRIPTCGHPDQPHVARGLCNACYQRRKLATHPEREAAQRLLRNRAYRERESEAINARLAARRAAKKAGQP